jgi:hypothetical protein
LAYADASRKRQRSEAKVVSVPADAYGYVQHICVTRTMMLKDGKNTRGVC